MPNGHYSSNKHCQKKSHKKKLTKIDQTWQLGKFVFGAKPLL